jgi:uncharacterized protein
MELLFKPWPWYVAGPVIGLAVPALLLLGNKSLGISSTLRQLCAACYPAKISLLQYDWKKDSWNLYFVAGILIGGFIGGWVLANPEPIDLSQDTIDGLRDKGLNSFTGLLPSEIFTWSNLTTWQGFMFTVVGGFLIGFGTRYARGCTSGHGIFGLSSLQWTSLLATVSFFIGGILCTFFILPFLLAL